MGDRVTVRPLARERVVDVGHREDAHEERDLRRRGARRDSRGRRIRSWCQRISGITSLIECSGSTMLTPWTGCRWMIANSSAVSRPGLSRIASGTQILPTSWSSPPAGGSPSRWASSPTALGERQGVVGDPLGVALGVRALGVDGAGEGEDDRLARLQADDPEAHLEAGAKLLRGRTAWSE